MVLEEYLKKDSAYNLLLFGTGSGCKDLLSIIDYSRANIIAFIDNNTFKQGTLINNIKVISPNEICEYDFDYIVNTSRYSDEIHAQLNNLGIERDKIIDFNLYYSNQFLESLNKNGTILNKFCTHAIENYFICNIQNLGRNRLAVICGELIAAPKCKVFVWPLRFPLYLIYHMSPIYAFVAVVLSYSADPN